MEGVGSSQAKELVIILSDPLESLSKGLTCQSQPFKDYSGCNRCNTGLGVSGTTYDPSWFIVPLGRQDARP